MRKPSKAVEGRSGGESRGGGKEAEKGSRNEGSDLIKRKKVEVKIVIQKNRRK